MDLLETCYYSRMAIFRDRPGVSVPGRWRFCPPGAKPAPMHLFGSRVWDYEPDAFSEDLGEQPVTGGYARAQNEPRLTGQKVCGSAFTWSHAGLFSQLGTPTVDEDGIPECCSPNPRTHGGGSIGDTAPFWVEYPLRSEGGLLIGGTSDWFEGWASTGGLLIGGASDFGTSYVSTGGLLIGGASDFGTSYVSTGGLLIGGASDWSTGVVADDSERLALRVADSIGIAIGIGDSVRLGLRVTDAVVLNPYTAGDSIRLALRVTDSVAVNPITAGDSIRLALRVTDSVAVNPFGSTDSLRLAIKITDSVTTH